MYTEAIDLSRISESVDLKVKLLVPEYARLESDQPAEVTVKLEAIPGATDAAAGAPPRAP
jgi:YbbR domain-containing protein